MSSRAICSLVFALFGPLAAVTLSAGSASAANDDGMLAFNNHCRQCHSYKKDDNRLGPSLYGIVGRKAGSLASYNNYSQALQNSNITWAPETLDKWITKPNAVVSDNNMGTIFSGLDDAAQRKSIIDFLKADTQLKTGAK